MSRETWNPNKFYGDFIIFTLNVLSVAGGCCWLLLH